MPAVSLSRETARLPRPRAERRPVVLHGRVTWKDSRGATRFASVRTRNVSETGIFIEWKEPTSLPLFRLVTFQVEREDRSLEGLPPALRAGKVLSAVYRAGSFQRSTGTPDGYGLRLLVDPMTQAAAPARERTEATA